MLLTFDKDGSVQFTRNPAALALVEGLGTLSITRMTDVRFDTVKQRFFIWFLTGDFEGRTLAWDSKSGDRRATILSEHFTDFWLEHSPGFVEPLTDPAPDGGFVYMRTYEDAVAIEVAFIDFLREQGVRVQ